MKRLILVLSFLLFDSAYGIPAAPPTYRVLAKAPKGLHLRLEIAPSPEGGSFLTYEIVDKKSKVLNRFPVSDTHCDSHAANGDVHGEKISVQECRSNLQNLEAELKRMKFKKWKIDPTACERQRDASVSLD